MYSADKGDNIVAEDSTLSELWHPRFSLLKQYLFDHFAVDPGREWGLEITCAEKRS